MTITHRAHQTVWKHYQQVGEKHANFAMQHMKSVEDIYPVFRELFKKNTQNAA
jgi:hypothetical protein